MGQIPPPKRTRANLSQMNLPISQPWSLAVSYAVRIHQSRDARAARVCSTVLLSARRRTGSLIRRIVTRIAS